MEQFARFPYVLVYAVVGVVFLFIGKLIYDLFTRYKLDAELTKEDNPAVGTAVLGYLVALIIIIARLIPEVGYDKLPKDSRMDTLVSDVINLAIYSFLGVVLLNFSRIIVDKLILFKFKINKELIDDKNVGTAAVLAGSYIASGLVIAGCLAGDIKPEMLQKAFNQSFSPLVSGLLLSLIFFMVGQLTLVLYSFVYSWVAPYNVHEQIEEDNVAAGIAFGGGLVALG
ncbi:MAG: DUF350 domain-containing protein, partial [Spirochaetota bacterium]|nr:DUF350 domain-containing protein [Spirochaetota bacterium]